MPSKTETWVVANNITASSPTDLIELTGGQELTPELIEQIGPSKMASMQRTRQVVLKSELEAKAQHPLDVRSFPDVGAENATVEQLGPDAKRQPDQRHVGPLPVSPLAPVTHPSMAKTGLHAANPTAAPQAWHGTSVEDLDVDTATKHALVNNNLRTIGDILTKGRAGEGLGEGIGEAREEDIQKAIAKVQRKNK